MVKEQLSYALTARIATHEQAIKVDEAAVMLGAGEYRGGGAGVRIWQFPYTPAPFPKKAGHQSKRVSNTLHR